MCPLWDRLMRLTPQFAALVRPRRGGGRILRAPERWRRLPWAWLALGAEGVPVLVVIAWQGSVWTVEQFFWVDLALGPAFGALLAGLAVGQPTWLVRCSTPARSAAWARSPTACT
jgi:hypothetical protein